MLRLLGKHRLRALCWVAAITVVSIATTYALTRRRSTGKNIQRLVYIYGAAENTAMMDVVGFESEAEDALKTGNTSRYRELQEKLREARARESYYAKQRRKFEQAASTVLGSSASEGLPSGVELPTPQYYLPETQKDSR